jgi:outer membrane protein assembly factor BamA
MKSLILGALLAFTCAFGQSRPTAKKAAPVKPAARSTAPEARWPIESFAVEGNRSYTREQIIAAAGLRVGQLAGRAEFDAARDRLVATGAFETVSYKFAPGPNGKGYAATFQVAEVQQVYPVSFEALGVFPAELEAAVRGKEPLFSAGMLPATQPVLERYAKFLQELLAKKGINEKVTGIVSATAPGEYAIVFRPSRNLPAIAQMAFEGNQVIPNNVLREAAAGAAIGSPYSEDIVRQLLNASVRPLYEMRGRVRVSFPKIRTEPAKDVEGVNVFVTVDEGQSYELGKVAIEGPTPLEPAALMKAGDFKTGDVANMTRVREGLERMRTELRRVGYMDAKVVFDRKIDDGRKAVDLEIRVDAGSRYSMGRLTVTGLDLHGESEVKRVWAMKTGAPYNPDYPDAFLKRARDMFDDLGETKSDIRLNERERTVDVTLVFKGSNAGKTGARGRGPGR